MFIKNGKRINIDVPYTDPETGTKGIRLTDPDNRAKYGVTEIPDPTPPEDFNPDYYFVDEQNEAPYIVYERKPLEMIEAAIIKRMDNAIESFIHKTVTDMGYVSVERLVAVYSNSPNPLWKAQALAVSPWITAVWEKALSILDGFEFGKTVVPTVEQLLEQLPKITEYILAE